MDENLGFDTQKEFRNGEKSSVLIYVAERNLSEDNNLKPLYISVYFNINNPKINEPIGILSNDDYFYDINKGIFYEKIKNKYIKIDPDDLLKKIGEYPLTAGKVYVII